MDGRVSKRAGGRDAMTPAQRHKAMRSNRGRTQPERRVASALWRAGFRYLSADGYRMRAGHGFPGSPDLIFVARRCVVFVDGCFWHGCNRCHDVGSGLNAWWLAKIEGNVRRDRRVRRRLRRQGWRVLVVREHSLRDPRSFDRVVEGLAKRIQSARPSIIRASRHRRSAGSRAA